MDTRLFIVYSSPAGSTRRVAEAVRDGFRQHQIDSRIVAAAKMMAVHSLMWQTAEPGGHGHTENFRVYPAARRRHPRAAAHPDFSLTGKINMRKMVFILVAAVISGCLTNAEPVKIFTASGVSEDNSLTFGTVKVDVNPDLEYINISGTVKKEVVGLSNDLTKREFFLFTRSGSDKMVLIETNTRGHSHPFRLPQDDVFINLPVIQKGTKPIDGKPWVIYVRALPEFPEQIFSAAKQKGIRIERYGCGLEIGAGKVVDRYHRIYIKYIMGRNDCRTLPQNGGTLSQSQLRSIRELAGQFDQYITISDQSGGA